MAVLCSAYPRQELNQATLDLYVDALLDLDYERAKKGVRTTILEIAHFPTIAEIRIITRTGVLGLLEPPGCLTGAEIKSWPEPPPL